MSDAEAPGARAGALRRWLPSLLIALAAIVPYVTALGNELLTWDDNIVILDQPFLRELTWGNLWRLLSPVPAREEWLPCRDLTLLLNFTIAGDDPLWFGAVNVALHAAASVAVLHLFRRLGLGSVAAGLGAAVFAVHAVHVESVTWLSGRKDPLSALFLVLALIAHCRFRDGEGRYASVLVYLVLALTSKASSFVFPLWAAAYDLCYRRELGRRERWLPIVPYAALSLSYIAAYLKLIRTDGVVEDYPPGGLVSVLLTNVVSFSEYTFHALLPWRHQAIYEVDFVHSWLSPRLLGATVVLGLVAASAWRWRRTAWLPFAVVVFYGSLVPYLNIVPHGIYYAERYLYLPTIAFALAAGILFAAGLERARRAGAGANLPARLAVAGAIAIFFGAHASIAAARNRVWADSETFWRYQASQLPRNPAPLMNLGETREIAGDVEGSQATYREVIERHGELPEAIYRLARVERRRGDLQEADRLYRRAIELAPGDPRPLNNLAEVMLAEGKPDAALDLYERAIDIAPRYLLARASLARTLEALGRPAEALVHWRHIATHIELLPQEKLQREALARIAELTRAP